MIAAGAIGIDDAVGREHEDRCRIARPIGARLLDQLDQVERRA